MKKTIKAWVMMNEDGGITYETIRRTRRMVIFGIEQLYGLKWPLWRDEFGYRIRRITIIVED